MHSPCSTGEKFVCPWAYGGSGAVCSTEEENVLLEAAKKKKKKTITCCQSSAHSRKSQLTCEIKCISWGFITCVADSCGAQFIYHQLRISAQIYKKWIFLTKLGLSKRTWGNEDVWEISVYRLQHEQFELVTPPCPYL